VVGVDGVVGVDDDPLPPAAAAMPTPLTAATAAEASRTAYLRMDIGASPFVHRARPEDVPGLASRPGVPKGQLSGG
jgi:hypothetical protein